MNKKSLAIGCFVAGFAIVQTFVTVTRAQEPPPPVLAGDLETRVADLEATVVDLQAQIDALQAN
jgi:uncharacterized protein YceH (UPF0502 family)